MLLNGERVCYSTRLDLTAHNMSGMLRLVSWQPSIWFGLLHFEVIYDHLLLLLGRRCKAEPVQNVEYSVDDGDFTIRFGE